MDFKPKLVVFDLDGTLAESKQRVTAEMGNLLGELIKKMPVAIMSGAAFHQFENQVLPALPADTKLENLYLFPTNSAQCYRHNADWEIIYDESFTSLERERILHALTETMEETGLGPPPQQLWGERIEDRGGQISFSALGQKAPPEEKKKWNQEHNGQRITLWQTLVPKLPDFSVAMGGLTTVDITRKGVTKAYGIGQLAGLTGISVSEMLYVGDALREGGNDSVVIPTGVRTQEVFGPAETAKIISTIVTQGVYR